MKFKLLKQLLFVSRQILFILIVQTLAMQLMFANETRSQNMSAVHVSAEFKNAHLLHVFKELEERTDFKFAYDEFVMEYAQKFSGKYENESLQDILEDISERAGVKFHRINETISVATQNSRQPVVIQAQEQSVSGKITDASGAPLPGVTVMVVGSTRGVITDPDGNYEIMVKPTDKLLISFIGMEPQEIEVNGRARINVVLQEKTEELEDVTVVAFGKQKKESVLASIETVNVDELKVPSSNLTTALAGRMSGVISYQRSGEPGQDNAEFFVRGVTSFGVGKKDPLILIDNVELTSNDLARLNPDDIASFSIMKDATATALYGARGANGVILVTTKEGKEGKAKVSVRFENSISMPTKDIEFADPITYMQLHNEAVLTRNPLGAVPYSQDKILNTIAGTNPYVYPATDWQSELLKDYAINQRVNLNLSGGGRVARYYIAGAFSQDNGILNVDNRNNFNNNIDLKKYLLRSNININVTKTTRAKVRLHGTFDGYTGPIDGGSGLYGKIMRTNPVLFPAVYEPDAANEYTRHTLFGNYGEEARYLNPYADLVKGYKDYSRSMMMVQFELEQDLDFITKGLRVRALGHINRYSYFDVSRSYDPYYYGIGFYDRVENTYTLEQLKEGRESLDYSEGPKEVTANSYLETVLQYDRKFDEVHGVSGLLVYTARESLAGNAGDLQQSLPSRNMGLSGRFTYSYDSRYFGEFNFGYNGSERFDKRNRFGFFPSAGFGWIVSNENFWNPVKDVISLLKLKATYGLTGNDAIGSARDRFFYLSNVNINDSSRGYTFGTNATYSRNGISISRYEDPDISWETSYKTNLGIELGLFENSLTIHTDIFRDKRTNILMTRSSIPTSMGLQASLRANVGEAISEGLDVSLDFNKVIDQNFWIAARGNFTYATSEFLVYEEPDYIDAGTPWRSKEGHKLGQQWGLVAERLFVDDEEVANSPVQTFGEYGAGDIKYRDINRDGVIDERDMVPIGYPTTPEIIYGFGVSMGYKAWDLSAFFQGSARSSFWISSKNTSPFIDINPSNNTIENNALLMVYANDHWSEDNRNIHALWPRLSDYEITNNTQASTWFMRDGSFLRLKSLEFGYSVPPKRISRVGLERLRFYFSGTNLLTFSNFKLWDPEMAGNGLGYPIQQVFNLGIQVSF
ncbi:SusC/RagA family TonB-linked outer membrane protein [Sunxiuqinia sp. sy24]|uniref:SusC/RagA family TonB-linked outer membrane protein n=1 Tax=Sunxiuqinia sp. sy24 TaxID=3461495 RepID=UPI004045EFA7